MIHDVLFKKIMNLLIYFFSKVELHCNGYIKKKKKSRPKSYCNPTASSTRRLITLQSSPKWEPRPLQSSPTRKHPGPRPWNRKFYTKVFYSINYYTMSFAKMI